MNPLTKAVDEIKFSIPFEILREAFKETSTWRQAPLSLDEQILTKVIRPRVIVDTNLVGGEPVTISLEDIPSVYVDDFTSVYEIPPEKLNNRTIVSVLSVGYLPYSMMYSAGGLGYGAVSPQTMTDVLMAGQKVMDSHSSIPPVSNARAELIAHNTVAVKDQYRVTSAYVMRCILANDENMNNLSPRSYLVFANLCVLAVKAYIYNTLTLRIGSAYLQGGQSLDEFKQIVDNYSDANEMYSEFLKNTWQAVSHMNSSENYSRFLRLQVNPAL